MEIVINKAPSGALILITEIAMKVGDRVKVIGGSKLEVKTPFYATVLRVYPLLGIIGKRWCGKELILLNEEIETNE